MVELQGYRSSQARHGALENGLMANLYTATDGGSIVYEVWAGEISHEELISHEHNQLRDPKVRPGAAVLVDATRADFLTPPEHVMDLSREHGVPDRTTSIQRYALLVNQPTWDRAQIFAAQARAFGVTIIVFNSLDVAAIWLGVPPALARTHLDALLATVGGTPRTES